MGRTRNQRKKQAREGAFLEMAPRLHERLTEASNAQLYQLRPHPTSKTHNLTVLGGFALLIGLVIYGGALRDSNAGDEPEDLDVMVPCTADTFVYWARWAAAKLQWHAKRVKIEPYGDLDFGRSHKGGPPATATIQFITETGMKLKVDLTAAFVLTTPDVDVNSLWITPAERRLDVRYNVGLSCEQLQAKCANKKFSLIKDITHDKVGERVTKLLGRGWEALHLY